MNSIHNNMKMVLGLLIMAFFSTLTAMAQTVVKDKDSGMPVGFATVVDEQGLFLGQTDASGLMPDLKDSKMFRITHVAYESIRDSVSHLGTELLLTPADLNLGEVVKVKGKPYCLRLTGYLRDYSILGHEVTVMKQKLVQLYRERERRHLRIGQRQRSLYVEQGRQASLRKNRRRLQVHADEDKIG